MPLETATYINQLNAANPLGSDPIAAGDDHLRLIKSALQATFPNITGPVTVSQSVINNPFPTGGIIMWSGAISAIPSGWALCDGSSGTPDLRDRFVVGAGSSYAVGATGGSKDAIVVAHSHSASSGTESANHTHYVSGTTGGMNANNPHSHSGTVSAGSGSFGSSASQGSPYQLNNSGIGASDINHGHDFAAWSGGVSANHTHAITVASSGSSGTNANLPPYLALAYIMKV